MSGKRSPLERTELTRRSFVGWATGGLITLAAGLGGGLAWLWGRGQQGDLRRRRHIEGRIVGSSHAQGHRLRGGGFPEPQEERRVGVLVAGGGIAGLSVGWKLARSGYEDFRILELEPTPGGNSRWGENGVSSYPWGAHYVPIPSSQSRAVVELLEEMGVVRRNGDGRPVYDERHLCHAPQERLFIHGSWQSGLFPAARWSAAEEAQILRFRERLAFWRRWKDARGRPAFALPRVYSSSDPEVTRLGRISMARYLEEEGFDSPRIRWFVDYACRDDYGSSPEVTSAWAGLHYFCAREREDPEVLTWPEGNGRIVRHLLQRFGEKVSTGYLVYRIEPREEEVVLDCLEIATERTVRFRARYAVYSLPLFAAPRIVVGWDRPGLSSFSYAPWMVANLTVDRLPEGAAWDNVLHRSPSLGYVVATHQALRTAPGPSVLTYYRPFAGMEPSAARRRLLETSWEGWRDEILDDLSAAHPELDRSVRRIDIMLHGHAMVRPTIGLNDEILAEIGRPFGRLRFAHSDLSGFSLFEEAQYHGVHAAEGILEKLGIPFESSL